MDQMFSEVAAAFLQWCKQARKPGTVNVYRIYLDKFRADNGDVPMRAVTPAMVSAWAKSWHHLQAVKRMFAWALGEASVIPFDPIARVKGPLKGARRRVLTPVEEIAILRAASPDLRALLIGLRETFARPQELRALTWADVIQDHCRADRRGAIASGEVTLTLWDYKARERRKDAGEPRVILVSPRFARLLCRLWDRRASDDAPIFATRRGRAWTANALRCRFRRMRSALNVRKDRRGETIVPYTFRHTGATRAAAAGVRDRLLADILGHTDTRTTQRYVHLQVDHLREAMRNVWKRHGQPPDPH